MARFGTASSVVGVIAGLVCIIEHAYSCHGPLCLESTIAPPGNQGVLFVLLAIILTLASLGTYVGPRVLFYVCALAGAGIEATELLNISSIVMGWLAITLVIVTASVILSILAAVQKSGVSEQSHPMNLPVFG